MTYRHVESQVLLSQDLFRKIALRLNLTIKKDTRSFSYVFSKKETGFYRKTELS